ncbi:MAG: hypothetical protein IPL63_06095 [Saprospiraceae bacterium]|nr:hypothetical protein [Saprospiraceae bacterium]MBK8371686.1 hypothetical protein [Saprospiraceae bacterium]MBK8546952.1 hypothetical protein [Saprospiraceae bacterium]MBK8853465.1 hypothetical protein [Saprospiraceae bacterium]MBK9041957.1 hypothetical protein [Saprospiraceae bacterium]
MEKLRGQLYVYKALRKTSGLELYVYKALRKNSGHELYVYKALRKNSGPELYVYKALRKNSGPELYVYKAPRKNSETNCTCTKHFGKTPGPIVPVQSAPEKLRNRIVHGFLSSEFFRGRLSTDFCVRNFSEDD